MHSSTFNHHYSLMQRALTLQGFRPKTIEAYLRTLRRVDERLKKIWISYLLVILSR